MLLVIAFGVGISYFTLGWVSNEVAVVGLASLMLYRNSLTRSVHTHFLPKRVLYEHDHKAAILLR